MRYDPFSCLPAPKPDPIFAVTAEALQAGPEAINGTIGVFMDEAGETVLFPSVRRAIADIASGLPNERYPYPPLLGLPEFRSLVENLIFGNRKEALKNHGSSLSGCGFRGQKARSPSDEIIFQSFRNLHVASIATTAGTGALAVNLRLLRLLTESAEIYLPTPAWANHPPPCLDSGFRILEIPYLVEGIALAQPLIDAVKRRKDKKSFAVLLQVSCHNPTGLDLSAAEWRRLAGFLAEKPCTVLLDFAYQGFKDDPEKDREAVQVYLDLKVPTLISWSASKNHSIYALRTGLACAVVPDEITKKSVEGTYSMITRRIHSAAATTGQRIVARVQEKYADEWRTDLKEARKIMREKRELMRKHLPPDFQDSLRGYGMFARLPLRESQVVRLKKDHNVFFTLDGRINIAGIPVKRIEELCRKIRKVV